MVWNVVMLPKTVKKLFKVTGLVLSGLLCFIIIYAAGSAIFHATYTSFCNLRDSNQLCISQTTSITITDTTYRLGGIGNIGIGSTRQEIINSVETRNVLIRIFGDGPPCSRYIFLDEPFNLPESTLGFYRVRTWRAIEFLFDDDDRVTKIRITPHMAG